MKKIIALLLCFTFVFGILAACNATSDIPDNEKYTPNTDNETADGDDVDGDIGKEIGSDDTIEEDLGGDDIGEEEIVDAKPMLNFEGVEAKAYTVRESSYQYTVGRVNRLLKFVNKTEEDFLGVCKYYSENGYELYGYNVLGNVLAATYVKNARMVHIYWIGNGVNELGIVNSESGGATLPPVIPEVTSGEYETIITQMRALEEDNGTRINGMGYVIRLADGSFIVYDGGYTVRLPELWNILTTLNGGEEGIVIRAWLLTHAHGDHDQCFLAFANEYGSKVTLEWLLASPTEANNDKYTSAIKKFGGAEIVYVHTGMVFRFCDVTMEILCSSDEIYYDGASDDFNNSSIVSRVYKEDGKSFMVLGDAGDEVADKLIPMYGEYLQSDICQASHHGVEDFTIEAYRLIRAGIWFYPCNTSLYNLTNRDREVRDEIKNAEYTKRIYLHDAKRRYEVSLNS